MAYKIGHLDRNVVLQPKWQLMRWLKDEKIRVVMDRNITGSVLETEVPIQNGHEFVGLILRRGMTSDIYLGMAGTAIVMTDAYEVLEDVSLEALFSPDNQETVSCQA